MPQCIDAALGRRLLYALLAGLLAGCAGPGYYLQAASGQMKLLHARRSVDTLLADPSTSTELAGRLEEAERILAFARERLDLPAHGSYGSYVDTGRETLVWNVIATGEFSLEPKRWCFPIAGCLPYRGYFKRRSADKFAAKLRKRGLDVIVTPSPAYSSLGWFKDPLLNTMLNGSDLQLAAYLFHELAHQRLYVKGDGRFNESYAGFVADAGVTAWLQSLHRDADLQKWRRSKTAGEDFRLLVRKVRTRLAEVYRSAAAPEVKRRQKTDILRGLVRATQQLADTRWRGINDFGAWLEAPLNNARLALFDTYEDRQCAFQQLYGKAGGQMTDFHALAKQRAKLSPGARKKWLDQACSATGGATMNGITPSKTGADL